MVPSVKVPVAVNCSMSPLAIEGFAGVTLIDTSAAGVTVNVICPLTLRYEAWMVADPVPTPVARPPEEIVATVVFSEAHVTDPVMSSVLPSAKVAVAVNWSDVSFAIDE